MNNFTKALIAAGIATFSMAGFAATQGDLGATSQGDVIIDVEIPDLLMISGLNDIDLGTYVADGGDMDGSDTFCVYSNQGSYKVTLTGNFDAAGAPGTDFYLENSGNVVPYSVDYNGTAATAGIEIGGQTGDDSSTNCSGATNSNILVTITETDIQASPPGAYTGVLTLLVEPE